MVRLPQSVTKRVALKAYLSSDHVSAATGKTIAIVLSKNGGAFGNPSGGATNATEIANGWYYVDLSTTDTGTQGPLIVRGTASATDDVEVIFEVADAHSAGFDGVPSVAAGATGGLPLSVDDFGRVDVLKINGTSQTARDIGASVLVGDKTGFSLTAAYDPAKTASQVGDIPTAAENADGLLGRNLAGGTDGGRTVTDALRPNRNKVTRTGATLENLTVYEEDDTTIAWEATLTVTPTAKPVTAVLP